MERTNKSATRGRPRKFDRDQALQQAMDLFWLGGFQGTSISELSQVMGVAPPSLYAAFGSKEDLFREAIALYLATEGNKAWQAFGQASCLKDAISALLAETVKVFTRAASPRGCLLMLGDKGMSPVSEGIHQWLQTQRDVKRQQLAAQLARAVDEGKLPAGTDVEALAASVFIFMSGLSIETADGVSESRLMKAIDDFVSHWPAPIAAGVHSSRS